MFKTISRSNHWIRKSTNSGTTKASNPPAIASPTAATSPAQAAVASNNSTRLAVLNVPCSPRCSTSSTLWPGNTCHTTQLTRATSNCLTARNMSTTKASNTDMSTTKATNTDMSTKETSMEPPKHKNRLAQEMSPYLLQHAHNPVNWYPWGEEAFERARRENKLIFLSVGYSTCHWCHVMERESFEVEAVAKIMNENFINVKVDREERPDIDKIYMQFVLMINGHGGWPMSVWLTPDLAPITAGTYFPPHDRWGMPSFSTVLKAIAEKWQSNQDELKSTSKHVLDTIKESLSENTSAAASDLGGTDAKLQEALHMYKQRYDQHYGGFGLQPKFPEVSRLNFLFHAFIATKDADSLDMAVQSLRHIGRGGIHDHVFGGFARYSVDRAWHVPHFEKMLYDQGQLMAAYANAYKLTHDKEFLSHADGIYRYLMKDLRHPGGGFYSGEDADSLPQADSTEKVEGAFYAWTAKEVKKAIEKNMNKYKDKVDMDEKRIFQIYAHHYDVRPTGNVEAASDPHGHLHAKNILIVRGSAEDTCAKFDITIEQLQPLLEITNKVLHSLRNKRPRPHLDTKIICSWNGLVLSGLAKLANCDGSHREKYMKTAAELVDFIRENLYDKERTVLRRSCYGVAINNAELQSVSADPIDGFLDDYTFLIKGLLDYYKSSLDDAVLAWAKQLQDKQDTLFWDETNGAYFYSQANSPNVVVRLKEDHDGAEPCGNSVAARNLILLSHYYDDASYRERAQKLLAYFANVRQFGFSLPEMMCALMLHDFGLDLVAVVGPDSEATKHFVEICRKFYIPGMIILHVDPNTTSDSYCQRMQEKFKMVDNKTTVYICHDKVCRMPVTDPVKLEANLMENFFKRN